MAYDSAFEHNRFADNTFTQLTAPGNTGSFGVLGLINHSMTVTVASINTNVVVEVEGSLDGTNFFDVPIDSQSAVTNMSVSSNRGTITANGTYSLIAKSTPIKYIRINFVSESGGTDATIDAVYHGST